MRAGVGAARLATAKADRGAACLDTTRPARASPSVRTGAPRLAPGGASAARPRAPRARLAEFGADRVTARRHTATRRGLVPRPARRAMGYRRRRDRRVPPRPSAGLEPGTPGGPPGPSGSVAPHRPCALPERANPSREPGGRATGGRPGRRTRRREVPPVRPPASPPARPGMRRRPSRRTCDGRGRRCEASPPNAEADRVTAPLDTARGPGDARPEAVGHHRGGIRSPGRLHHGGKVQRLLADRPRRARRPRAGRAGRHDLGPLAPAHHFGR